MRAARSWDRLRFDQMRLVWNFIGRAAEFAGRVQGLEPTAFEVGTDEVRVLPVKGDLLLLRVSGSAEPIRFKCSGRHFDLASPDGPVMHLDIELR